jgi:hypothetical protein
MITGSTLSPSRVKKLSSKVPFVGPSLPSGPPNTEDDDHRSCDEGSNLARRTISLDDMGQAATRAWSLGGSYRVVAFTIFIRLWLNNDSVSVIVWCYLP